MSLSSAVLAVAEQIEEDASGEIPPSIHDQLMAYVKMLRIAVKSSEREPDLRELRRAAEDGQEAALREYQTGLENAAKFKAKKAQAELEHRATAEEKATGSRMVEVVDPNDPLAPMVTILNEMPVGAWTNIPGSSAVYQLRADGKLHLDEEQTAKRKQ